MAPSITREWCNVEIELQPLLCGVNLNVEYAFSQTALRGILIWQWKASSERWVSEPEEEGREEKQEKKSGSPTGGKAKSESVLELNSSA